MVANFSPRHGTQNSYVAALTLSLPGADDDAMHTHTRGSCEMMVVQMLHLMLFILGPGKSHCGPSTSPRDCGPAGARNQTTRPGQQTNTSSPAAAQMQMQSSPPYPFLFIFVPYCLLFVCKALHHTVCVCGSERQSVAMLILRGQILSRIIDHKT